MNNRYAVFAVIVLVTMLTRFLPAVEISAGLCYNTNRRECCQANGQHLSGMSFDKK